MTNKLAVAVALVISMLLSACGGGSGRVNTGADAALASLVSAAPASAAADGNLLLNPGFEAGLASWQDWGNTLVVDGAGAAGTLRALRVGTSGGGSGQEVPAVVAGARYRLSVQARVSAASDTVVIGVNFVDASGANVVQETVPVTSTSYLPVAIDLTAPANAVKALVYVWKNTGPGYAFVDEFSFVAAASSNPNLVANGGFEAALDGWGNWGNAAAVTGQSNSGALALRVGSGAGGVGQTIFRVQAGTTYRISGQVKVSDSSEVGYLGLAFVDAAGNHVQEQNVAVRSTSYTTAQLEMVAPPGAERALAYVWKNAGPGFTYVDDIVVNASRPAIDFGVVPLASWPNTLLQVGNPTDAYWLEDGVWAAQGLTRGHFTGINGTSFEQYTGVSPVVGPNGEVAGRIAWKWPTCCTEIKSFPAFISGQKPGYFNTWTTPGGHDVRLPDGSISQVYPSGRTPGTFFPLQLPIASLKTSFAHKHMSPPTGRGQLAYDMFLQSTPTQSNSFGPGITHEIIVPVDYWGGYGTYPTRNPQWYDHDVTIEGILYHVYIYKDATGFVLSSFSGGWKFIVFEPDQPIPPGMLDLARIVNYVTTRRDVFGIPWATGNEYLVNVELGVETQVGTGDIQVNDFRVWR